MRIGIDYPTYGSNRSGAQRSDPPAIEPTPIPPDEIAPGVPVIDTYFPYVMHQPSKAVRIFGVRWNSWDQGNNFAKVPCRSTRAYWTRPDGSSLQLPSQLFFDENSLPQQPPPLFGFGSGTVYDPWTLFQDPSFIPSDSVLCVLMTMRSFPVSARSDQELLVTSSRFWQRVRFDAFKELRVPRVVMTLLPDNFIAGDGYTADPDFKMVELERVKNGGREELLLQVRMRRSDLNQGQMELNVPVFAVDGQGALMENANGLFNAKFADIVGASDCGDCVMINGRANIKVKINPNAFLAGDDNGQRLELNKMLLWGTNVTTPYGQPDCYSSDFDGIGALTGYALYGCSTIDTSHEAPKGIESVPESSYPDLEDALQASPDGKIFMFDDARNIRLLRDLSLGYLKATYNSIKLIPVIGSMITIIEQLSECIGKASGDPDGTCDVIGILGSVAQLGIDLAARGSFRMRGITPAGLQYLGGQQLINAELAVAKQAVQAMERVPGNRGAAGSFVKLLERAINPLVRSKQSAEVIIARMKTLTEGVAKAVSQCRASCQMNFEKVLKKMTGRGDISVDDILFQMRRFWEINGRDIIQLSKDCVMGIADKMLYKQVTYGLQTDLETLANVVRPRAPMTMTLGMVLNKFVDTRVLPSTIDDARAPPVGAPSPAPLPELPQRLPPLVNKLVKKGCGELVKQDDKDESYSYCDRLMGNKKVPDRGLVICDALARKASVNFEEVMTNFVGIGGGGGQLGIDTVTGEFAGLNGAWNFASGYLPARRKYPKPKVTSTYEAWHGYAYCDNPEFNAESETDCRNRIPLLETNKETGRWKLSAYTEYQLKTPVVARGQGFVRVSQAGNPKARPVDFNNRIAHDLIYKKFFSERVSADLHDQNFDSFDEYYADFNTGLRYRRFMEGKSDLHHIIPDNLWKKDGLLRKLMLSNDPNCNRHMDMKFNLTELANSADNLANADDEVQNRLKRAYNSNPKRTFSRVIHSTKIRMSHRNYDNFILRSLVTLHGKSNNASWSNEDCATLKLKLEEIYTTLRWVLLNAGQENQTISSSRDSAYLGYLKEALRTNAIVKSQDNVNYFITDVRP